MNGTGCTANQILQWTGAVWICTNQGSGADHLGNHTATLNLNMDGNTIVGAAIDTQGLHVEAGGDVGIGTTSPGASLDVLKSTGRSVVNNKTDEAVSADAYAAFQTATVDSGLWLAAHGNNRTLSRTGQVLGGWTEIVAVQPSGNTNHKGLIVGTNTNTPMLLGSNNLERVRITESGNVGIGTTSPATKLDVYNSAANWETLSGTALSSLNLTSAYDVSGTGEHRITFSKSRGTLDTPIASQDEDFLSRITSNTYDGNNYRVSTEIKSVVDGVVGIGDTPGRLEFYTTAAGGSSTVRMTIKESGFVGIGTASPNRHLEVSQASNPIIASTNTSASGAPYFIGYQGNGGALPTSGKNLISIQGRSSHADNLVYPGINIRASEAWTDTAQGSDIYFRTSTNGTTVTSNRMIIQDDGNVGIGTTAPSETLEVNGNILASGTITPSDERFKDNKVSIEDSLKKIKQLTGYRYIWNTKSKKGTLDLGVLAQEVEGVFPMLVSTYHEGTAKEYKAVNYSGLIAPIINSLKELDHNNSVENRAQNSEIEALKAKNDKLEQELAEIKKLLKRLSYNK